MKATAFGEWFAVPPRGFEGGLQLRSPEPPVRRERLATWLLMALTILWFAPRALMALKLNTICRDGVFYIQLGQDLDQGNLQRALDLYHFNLYPTMLMLLHRLGLDWEVAGRWLGVVMSTALLFPLLGWLRQHFDRRIAVLTCVLLGVHPKLIEWSPEVIREPLFWFLFMSSLYLIWEATLWARWWQFAVAGLVTTLAVQTRFEGWTLLFPALCWPAWRGWHVPALRGRLAGGTLLLLAMCPLFLLVLNATWFRDCQRWELGNFQRLQYVQSWIESFATKQEKEPEPTTGPAIAQVAESRLAAPSASPGRRANTPVLVPMPLPPDKPQPGADHQPTHVVMWNFLRTMERGLHPLYALLMLYGLLQWRHLWLRPDILVFWAICLAHLAGIWIHLWFAHESSSRYALLIILLGSAWVTLAMLDLSRRFEVLIGVRLGRLNPPGRLAAVICALLIAVGMVDALSKNVSKRRAVAELGTWIQDEFGPQCVLLGTSEISVITPYYAGSKFVPLQESASNSYLLQLVEQKRPDLVVISRHPKQQPFLDTLLDQGTRFEVELIEPDRVPSGPREHWQVVKLRHRSPVVGKRAETALQSR